MTAWEYLKEFKANNPNGFSVLLAAIATATALSIITSMGINFEAQVANVTYVVVIGVVVSVVGLLMGDRLISGALKWFAAVLLVGWVCAFVYATAEPDNKVANCLARFWKACATTADKVAEAENPKPLDPGPLPPVPSAVKPQDYSVFFQFAGSLKREDVRDVMIELMNAGWGMQGVERGGQRTATAAGFAEVRYGDVGDAVAATELAKAVQASKLTPKPMKTSLNRDISRGTLEIYVSN